MDTDQITNQSASSQQSKSWKQQVLSLNSLMWILTLASLVWIYYINNKPEEPIDITVHRVDEFQWYVPVNPMEPGAEINYVRQRMNRDYVVVDIVEYNQNGTTIGYHVFTSPGNIGWILPDRPLPVPATQPKNPL